MSKATFVLDKRTLDTGDYKRMRLPETYWDVTLDQLSPLVRGTIESYLEQVTYFYKRGIGLILAGPDGGGKTIALVAIAKELAAWRSSVLYGDVLEIREQLRMNASYDDELSLMERLRSVPTLMLDGLTVEDATARSFAFKDITGLIRYRAMRGLVTFSALSCEEMDMRRGPLLDFLKVLLGVSVRVFVPGGDGRCRQDQEARQRLALR